MHKIKYALFYDFHTSPLHPDVGRDFDAEKLADRFAGCGVDYVTFHARCNMGMAYYNTKIGTRHPSLKFDLFGELVKSCRKRNIGVGAYFNAGLSRNEGVEHRDWSVLTADGKNYFEPFASPFSLRMCYNSPYRDHLTAMVKEVGENYPVSGFFFDCIDVRACVCPHCVKKMTAEGFDFRKPEDVEKFGLKSQIAFANDLSKAAREYCPEALIYFNGVTYEDQADSATYLEFECLPCKSGGYQYMHTQPHYMRTLGKQCVHMTGRFNRWSDFGGLRNVKTLRYELLFALANGIRPNIGDHLNPTGAVCEPVFDISREVFGELRKYERYFDDAVVIADTAIVWHDTIPRVSYPVNGAIRMLTELKIQFDIATRACCWDKYKLLVLPDTVVLDDELRAKLDRHISRGGFVVATGSSGLGADNQFPEAWGVKFEKMSPFSPAYFKMNEPGVVEDMPFAFYDEAAAVTPADGSAVAAPLIAPAVQYGWDGLYPEYYNPPYDESGYPFLVLNGKIAYFSGNIFSGYIKKAPPQVRSAFAYALEKIGFAPVLKLENAPSFLQVFSGTTAENSTTVSMFAYIPEKRGIEAESIEDELIAGNFTVLVKTAKDPVKAYIAPDGAALPFERRGEYIAVTIPQFTGFSMLVLE